MAVSKDATVGDARFVDVVNPATLACLARVRITAPDEWPAALARASAAMRQWQRLSRGVRAQRLAQVAAAIEANAHELAKVHAGETGQPLAESQEAVVRAADCWNADSAQVASHDVKARRPVALLKPRASDPLEDWAHLASTALLTATPALIALDAIAPLTVVRASALSAELPPDLLQVLLYAGAGIPATGASAQTVQVAELAHGTEALYVGADADLDLAVAGVSGLRLRRSGQQSALSARVYVDQPLIYRLADALHAAMAFLEAGDPMQARTDLGPLASPVALEQVATRVGEALRCGVLLKLGGRRYQPWGLTGYFFQPTLLIEGRGAERAPQEQIAGPVILLSPVRNLVEALADRPAGATIRMRLFTADAPALIKSLPSAWRERLASDSAPHPTARLELRVQAERDPRWFPYQARATTR